MKFGRIFIGCFTATLMALAFLTLPLERAPVPAPLPLTFSLETEGGAEQLTCWENPEGTYVMFLPGYAELERLHVIPGTDGITVDGQAPPRQMTCGDFQLDQPYDVTWTNGEGIQESTITFVQSENVPTLYIDVASGSMEYLHMDKNHKEPGSLRLYGTDGTLLCEERIATIKGRGNTSWYPDKKPYNIALSYPQDLLGMGAAENWVLLAEEYNDVNIRNKIVYDFAPKAGLAYSPDCRWVDLYLNGEYVGLYLLTERLEVHPQRIDIAPEGSFLVSMEYESRLQDQKYPYIRTEAGCALRVRYGPAELSGLLAHWQQAENAILSEDGTDPVSGRHWRELIDLDSWARKYLVEEVFGNMDAGSLSQYYYFDGSDPAGKIYAGPVWDYDFAMDDGSVWLTGYTDYFTMNRPRVNDHVSTPWFPALYRQPEFLNRVKELYAAEFLPLMEELLAKQIPAYLETIRIPAQMDRLRWGLEEENVDSTVNGIRDFLEARLSFLTDLWIRGTRYHTVCVDADRDLLYGYLVVKNGETLSPLPDYESRRGLGWYNAATGEPFDITQPIYEDVSIYVKKPEDTLPVIHYLPMLTLVLALPLLAVLDRVRAGRREKEKCPSPIQ